jgi:hypothetical protein
MKTYLVRIATETETRLLAGTFRSETAARVAAVAEIERVAKGYGIYQVIPG